MSSSNWFVVFHLPKNHYKEIVTRIRIRIHLGPGSGSTIFKGGSEDPDPDPQFSKGGSEDPDPDPLYQNVDPGIRIRIHVKIVWIRNPAPNPYLYNVFIFTVQLCVADEKV